MNHDGTLRIFYAGWAYDRAMQADQSLTNPLQAGGRDERGADRGRRWQGAQRHSDKQASAEAFRKAGGISPLMSTDFTFHWHSRYLGQSAELLADDQRCTAHPTGLTLVSITVVSQTCSLILKIITDSNNVL